MSALGFAMWKEKEGERDLNHEKTVIYFSTVFLITPKSLPIHCTVALQNCDFPFYLWHIYYSLCKDALMWYVISINWNYFFQSVLSHVVCLLISQHFQLLL